SVTMEVGVDALVTSMSNNPKDPKLVDAIKRANELKANSDADFVKLFGQAYEQIAPGGKLAGLFTKPNQPKISLNSTNEQVLAVIRTEAKEAVKRTYNVLTKRIDKFGVTQPTINLDESKGIITVELAGVKDPESVRKVLQATAKLQFWEVATMSDIGQQVVNANNVLEKYLKNGKEEPATDTTAVAVNDTTKKTDTTKAVAATTAADTNSSLSSLLDKEDTGKGGKASVAGAAKDESLFSIMRPELTQQGPTGASYIGLVARKDAPKLKEYLEMDIVKNQFPSNIKFLFGQAPGKKDGKESPVLAVYAIRMNGNGSQNAKLEGDHVKTAKFDYQNGKAEISLEMDQQGSMIWAQLTGANVGHPIAITLDDFVYSAPNVNQKIEGGRSSITGDFSAKEGDDLANILQTGKLDAPAKIVQEQVVGPTLGQESIDGGIESFGVAFLVIFILMIVYYSTGGIVANVALLLNLLFTFGVLANLGATLTMAGIAGIVLGIGMAVDTNVLIFERIKEELALGDTYADAVAKGYKRSYAPVLDGHITSLITAVVLYVFGLGPIKGFATTQIIALLLSLFTGILVSRLITDMYMKRGRHFNYFTKLSKSIFQKAHFKFIEKRKIAYVFSTIMILLGVASLFHGFDYGVEFDGGRSYTIKFDQPHKVSEVREKLQKHLEKYPVVKTIGVADQLNITTDYLIGKPGINVEAEVLNKLYNGLKAEQLIPATVDVNTFETKYVQSKQTVLPTISKDLKKGALYATLISVLAIFIYIFGRFRKWQYSMGTIVSV
ncbi:MAG: protein translocase subunit SecD, partial [Sphingobacteriales bacterium]